MGTAVVLRAHKWKNNAALFADVARLGYLDGSVLDTTWGLGNFWKLWQPEVLVGCDINPGRARDVICDFSALPFADTSFDSVVFDPEYKTSGSTSEFNQGMHDRFGVREYRHRPSWRTIYRGGFTEALRVARRYVLVKCQNQVANGQVQWQSFFLMFLAEEVGARCVDQFDLLFTPRPQRFPQKHARSNSSSLLVFAP